jgi:hypothetical protein
MSCLPSVSRYQFLSMNNHLPLNRHVIYLPSRSFIAELTAEITDNMICLMVSNRSLLVNALTPALDLGPDFLYP